MQKNLYKVKGEKRDKINYIEVGNRIWEIRNKIKISETASISQEKFLEDFNNEISVSVLSRIENGSQLPSPHFLVDLNNHYEADTEYILYGKISCEADEINSFLNSADYKSKSQFMQMCECISRTLNDVGSDCFDFDDEEEYLDVCEVDEDKEVCIYSARMKKIRKVKNMTVNEVANKVGVTSNVVYKWEKLSSTPSINTIIDFCEKMEVSINYILLGNIMSKRNEVSEILLYCSYSKQVKLLKIFCEILRFFNNSK